MRDVSVAFMPLTDAAPLVIAHEIGFAAEEGLSLRLERQPSWSAVRDRLAFGEVEAAHLLAPVPVAMSLGLGGVSMPVDALQVLSTGGVVIGVSRPLGARLRDSGADFSPDDPRATGGALLAVTGGNLRLGVPFPFSMQTELVQYWLGHSGWQGRHPEIRIVPPPQMGEALAAGEIDAFCVGEPWGSIAAETGVGEIILPGSAIWSAAPEKVLAMRHELTEADPGLTAALMRAVWRAQRWLSQPENLAMAGEILARGSYVDVAPEIIDQALTGRLPTAPGGELQLFAHFIEFFHGLAPFPWRSQGAWIGDRLAARYGLDPRAARAAGAAVFRSDLYRRNLAATGAVMPGTSSKVEGALESGMTLYTGGGEAELLRNRFFDGAVFDPDA